MNQILKFSEIKELEKFEKDLEFLQMLTSSHYISYLIQNDFFEKENFLNYLKYLEYLKNDDFIIYVKYPVSLKILEIIQKKDFIKNWKNNNFYTELINNQIFAHYMNLDNIKLNN